jgi:hypothetical protein
VYVSGKILSWLEPVVHSLETLYDPPLLSILAVDHHVALLIYEPHVYFGRVKRKQSIGTLIKPVGDLTKPHAS